MIRYLILLSIIFTAKNISAQNYEPVSSHSLKLFKTSFTGFFHTANTYNIVNQPGYYEISAVKIDSAQKIQSDSLIYLNNDIRKTPNTDPFDDHVQYKNTGSVFGNVFKIDSTGTYTASNYLNENIYFKNQQEWIFYSNDSLYFKATFLNYSYENILMEWDSVKNIKLQAYNNQNETISSTFNTTIKISKHFGLVDFPSLNYFPVNYYRYTLAGIPELNIGKKPLTNRLVFDFEAGDEFHYFSEGLNPPDSWAYIDKILTKTISALADTIYYNIHRIREQSYFIYGVGVITNIDSFDFVLPVTNLDNYLAGTQTSSSIKPNELFELQINNTNFYQLVEDSSLNNRTCMYLPAENLYYDEYYSCYLASHFETVLPYSLAIEGCGIYSTSYMGDPYDPAYYCNPCETFVYYKKGNEIWGTPIVITDIPVLNYNEPEITIHERHITFKNFNEQNQYIVSDIFGRIIKNGTIPGNTSSLTLSGLSSGIYFLSIITEKKIITRKIFY